MFVKEATEADFEGQGKVDGSNNLIERIGLARERRANVRGLEVWGGEGLSG